MKQLFLSSSAFLFALMLSVTSASETIYKWKDKSGAMHFSATPPKTQTDAEIMAKPEPQNLSNHAGQMTENEEPGEATVKKQATEAVATEPATAAGPTEEEPQQKAEKDLAYCNALKSNMTMLSSSPRVRVKTSNGEYEILDDTARQKEIARIKKLQDMFCQG